ncbi:MAG TPA: hypothetical protein PKL46_00220 [Aquabacterium sp.]|nr:hypothetical protein [Aquabacterium sp.]
MQQLPGQRGGIGRTAEQRFFVGHGGWPVLVNGPNDLMRIMIRTGSMKPNG